MIVTSSNSSASSALQGLDLLNRSFKTDQKDSADSNFSDFLGSSTLSDTPITAVKGAVRRAKETSPSGEKLSSGDDGATTAFGSARTDDGQSAGSGPVDGFGLVRGGSLLEGGAELPRDPRLNDPAELALEAAAIALAATLLQRTPEVTVPCVAVDDSNLGGPPQQGSSEAFQSDTPASNFQAPSAPLPASLHTQDVVTLGVPTASAGKPGVDQEKTGARLVAVGDSTTTVEFSPTEPATNPVVVGRRIVANVVLRATPAEAAGLANTNPGYGVMAGRQAEVGGGSGIALAANEGVLSVFSRTVNSSDITKTPIENDLAYGVLSPSLMAPVGAGDSDSKLLSSAFTESPAAAFFASQAEFTDQFNGVVGSSLPQDQASQDQPSQEQAVLSPTVVETQHRDDGRFGLSNSGDGDVNQDEQLGKAKPFVPRSAAKSSGEDGVMSEGGLKLGTLGAKDRGVLDQPIETSISVQESPASHTHLANEESAVVSSQNSSLRPSFLTSENAATFSPREIATKPTVLPTVHSKLSELANVVQRVLERARSENPSHLAVDVQLEDGSSFGLEVRMSSAGLQASFRSDSQPLLRALESNWAGFLAKESADQKAVSAAFEARTGFGQFSDNRSDSGERRERLEDGASSAFLGALDRGETRGGEAQGGALSDPNWIRDRDGVALYA